MGFQFSETMAGTIEWDDAPGKTHPFKFEVTAHASSLRAHLADGRAELRGVVFAPPIADEAPCEGHIVIRPLGARIIRYELAFTGDDGRHYELVGQKDIRYRHLVKTWTTLPGEILDDEHRRIGTYLAYFDLKHDGWSFLRSFRPA